VHYLVHLFDNVFCDHSTASVQYTDLSSLTHLWSLSHS